MKKSRTRKKTGTVENAHPRKRTSPSSVESGDSGTRTFRQGAISIFILFHLIAITCWAVPSQFPPVRAIKELVRPYMLWSGLFQSWDMFAPNPRPVNSYIKAVVITQNHHIHVWTFPRMEELSLSERYRKERYRKFTDVLPEQVNAALWPDVASHLARYFDSQADPSEHVTLVQFSTDIKPGADESFDPVPKPTVFYEDYVQPENLK